MSMSPLSWLFWRLVGMLLLLSSGVLMAAPRFSWVDDSHDEILVELPEIDREYVFDNSLNPYLYQPQDMTDFTGSTNAILCPVSPVNFRFQVSGYMAYGGTFGSEYDFQGYETMTGLIYGVWVLVGIGLFFVLDRALLRKILPVIVLVVVPTVHADEPVTAREQVYFREMESIEMINRCFGNDPDSGSVQYRDYMYPLINEPNMPDSIGCSTLIVWPYQQLDSYSEYVDTVSQASPAFLQFYEFDNLVSVETYYPQCSLYLSIADTILYFSPYCLIPNIFVPTSGMGFTQERESGGYDEIDLGGSAYFSPGDTVLDVNGYPDLLQALHGHRYQYSKDLGDFRLFVQAYAFTYEGDTLYLPFNPQTHDVIFTLLFDGYAYEFGPLENMYLVNCLGNGSYLFSFSPLNLISQDAFNTTDTSTRKLRYRFHVEMSAEQQSQDHMFTTVLSALSDLQLASVTPPVDTNGYADDLYDEVMQYDFDSNGLAQEVTSNAFWTAFANSNGWGFRENAESDVSWFRWPWDNDSKDSGPEDATDLIIQNGADGMPAMETLGSTGESTTGIMGPFADITSLNPAEDSTMVFAVDFPVIGTVTFDLPSAFQRFQNQLWYRTLRSIATIVFCYAVSVKSWHWLMWGVGAGTVAVSEE